MGALVVREGVVIDASELSFRASRASGPGGQNVNKVASKVELCFDLARSTSLTPAVKARLAVLVKGALDQEGVVHIVSQVTRDQARNLDDARTKLARWIALALVVPKKRRPTKPTRGSQERRLNGKRIDSEKKATRRRGADD